MILADVNLHDQTWHLVGLLIAIAQPVLVAVLCAGFVLASAHLAAMLGTQWGKRRVSGKALFFSIAVHVSLTCGIFALLPEYAQVRQVKAEGDTLLATESVPIRAIAEEPAPEPADVAERAASTPVWEQLPETLAPAPTRMAAPQPLPEAAPLERPQPQDVAAQQPLPDTAPLPDLSASIPMQAPRADSGELELAAVPRQVDDPEAQSRPEVEVPSAARARSHVVAAGTAGPERIERPQTGAVDRVTPDSDPSREIASVSGIVEPMARARRTDDDLESMRREGPAPSPVDLDAQALGTREPSEGTASSAPATSQIARSRTRTPRSPNDTGEERVRPSSVPQRPDLPDDLPISSLMATTGTAGGGSRMERPELSRPEGGAGGDASDGSRVPATYQLRTQEQRQGAARRFGGTEDSERAVERSLAWLARNQHPDGYWDADAHGAAADLKLDGRGMAIGPDGTDRKLAGREADTGLTGLAILAFLGAGNTLHDGRYADNVRRAIGWLAAQQRVDGSLAGNIRNGATDFMYCHAMATFALAEAYALESDKGGALKLRGVVERAVQFALAAQLGDGGWRYGKYDERSERVDSDMSIFGWQLMALKSAELGGIVIPSDAKARMIDFLKVRGRGRSGGLASYRAGDRESPSMTAEALFCKQMLGITRTNPASVEAVQYLTQYPPRRSTMNLYYWYYGTLAMFQFGGEPWERWNSDVRDLLVQDQRTDGALDGSWDPHDIWGVYGGRIYSTAVATLCLEVYYRYLPLYRLGESFDNR